MSRLQAIHFLVSMLRFYELFGSYDNKVQGAVSGSH